MTGPELLTLREAGSYLRAKDARTTRRRLAELGVPVVRLGRDCLVCREDLVAAVRSAAVVEPTTGARTQRRRRPRRPQRASGTVERGWWRKGAADSVGPSEPGGEA